MVVTEGEEKISIKVEQIINWRSGVAEEREAATTEERRDNSVITAPKSAEKEIALRGPNLLEMLEAARGKGEKALTVPVTTWLSEERKWMGTTEMAWQKLDVKVTPLKKSEEGHSGPGRDEAQFSALEIKQRLDNGLGWGGAQYSALGIRHKLEAELRQAQMGMKMDILEYGLDQSIAQADQRQAQCPSLENRQSPEANPTQVHRGMEMDISENGTRTGNSGVQRKWKRIERREEK